jgi:hypothetical protein
MMMKLVIHQTVMASTELAAVLTALRRPGLTYG